MSGEPVFAYQLIGDSQVASQYIGVARSYANMLAKVMQQGTKTLELSDARITVSIYPPNQRQIIIEGSGCNLHQYSGLWIVGDITGNGNVPAVVSDPGTRSAQAITPVLEAGDDYTPWGFFATPPAARARLLADPYTPQTVDPTTAQAYKRSTSYLDDPFGDPPWYHGDYLFEELLVLKHIPSSVFSGLLRRLWQCVLGAQFSTARRRTRSPRAGTVDWSAGRRGTPPYARRHKLSTVYWTPTIQTADGDLINGTLFADNNGMLLPITTLREYLVTGLGQAPDWALGSSLSSTTVNLYSALTACTGLYRDPKYNYFLVQYQGAGKLWVQQLSFSDPCAVNILDTLNNPELSLTEREVEKLEAVLFSLLSVPTGKKVPIDLLPGSALPPPYPWSEDVNGNQVPWPGNSRFANFVDQFESVAQTFTSYGAKWSKTGKRAAFLYTHAVGPFSGGNKLLYGDYFLYEYCMKLERDPDAPTDPFLDPDLDYAQIEREKWSLDVIVPTSYGGVPISYRAPRETADPLDPTNDAGHPMWDAWKRVLTDIAPSIETSLFYPGSESTLETRVGIFTSQRIVSPSDTEGAYPWAGLVGISETDLNARTGPSAFGQNIPFYIIGWEDNDQYYHRLDLDLTGATEPVWRMKQIDTDTGAEVELTVGPFPLTITDDTATSWTIRIPQDNAECIQVWENLGNGVSNSGSIWRYTPKDGAILLYTGSYAAHPDWDTDPATTGPYWRLNDRESAYKRKYLATFGHNVGGYDGGSIPLLHAPGEYAFTGFE